MVVRVNYVSGTWERMYSFESRREVNMWEAQLLGIKKRIAQINEDGNAGAARVPKYRLWRRSAIEFLVAWGQERVPPDIKMAVNSVEEEIGVEPTAWEELALLSDGPGDEPVDHIHGSGCN